MDARLAGSGPGWHVYDLVCSAGPLDSPFEERHASVAIAAVMSGTFVYRTAQGSALLAPGSILLGNFGRCFECGHEHGIGDRCLSFHFTRDYWEDVVAAVPGVRKADFETPSLPPAASLLPLTAALEAAAQESDLPALEETSLELAGLALRLAGGLGASRRKPSEREERRISQAVRLIERAAHEVEEDRVSLGLLAREAGMSRYHFLRTFRDLMGLTPHQYVLRMRMNRAAVRLRTSDDAISAIALEAGFNDISTFNRRFRRILGTSPGTYRRQARRQC